MPSVLVTGANRGLGLEFVRQYSRDGWRVHAACRRPERLSELSADVTVHRLDVGSPEDISALAEALRGEALDVLVNSAGLYGGEQSLESIDYENWAEVMRINCIAQVRVVEALRWHLARGEGGVIANLTSKMGSMAENTSGGAYIYRSSKAALNAVTVSLAHDLAAQGIIVIVLHPGWVKTDMGGPNALIEAEQSIAGMRRVIEKAGPEMSGGFFSYDGSSIAW